MSVGHGRIRLLRRGDVASVSAPAREAVGHGSIYVGRRPDVAVAQLFAASAEAAKDDIVSVLVSGGRR